MDINELNRITFRLKQRTLCKDFTFPEGEKFVDQSSESSEFETNNILTINTLDASVHQYDSSYDIIKFGCVFPVENIDYFEESRGQKMFDEIISQNIVKGFQPHDSTKVILFDNDHGFYLGVVNVGEDGILNQGDQISYMGIGGYLS